MSFDHVVSLISASIAFMGLVFVAVQLRNATRQRMVDSQIRLYDINRELISLGFSHPQLFDILADSQRANPVWERRYLQLWLNQFTLIHAYMDESVFKRELKDSLVRDISEFMAMENMKRHWRHHGSFCPASFQEFVNDIIKKNEPPAKAAQVETDKHQAAKT